MKWEQVRKQYPEQWVLVEAISAYSANATRHISELSVISNSTNQQPHGKHTKNII